MAIGLFKPNSVNLTIPVKRGLAVLVLDSLVSSLEDELLQSLSVIQRLGGFKKLVHWGLTTSVDSVHIGAKAHQPKSSVIGSLIACEVQRGVLLVISVLDIKSSGISEIGEEV